MEIIDRRKDVRKRKRADKFREEEDLDKSEFSQELGDSFKCYKVNFLSENFR